MDGNFSKNCPILKIETGVIIFSQGLINLNYWW